MYGNGFHNHIILIQNLIQQKFFRRYVNATILHVIEKSLYKILKLRECETMATKWYLTTVS